MLSSLNDSQKLAAQHIDGPLLILAGAGSGKTKTITTRLAYLISLGIDPASILTLTFTNKAATEMRNRAYDLIEEIKYPPLLCTFHKFGLLFLKFHISKLGRKNNFVIIDSDDRKKILKMIDKETTTSILSSEISKFKNLMMTPNDVKQTSQDKLYAKVAKVYEQYEEYLFKNNLVDFDDLLLLTYKILDTYSDVAKETSMRYQYIMVDEYQDTNELQYKLLQKLCTTHNNLCVVGDDDQSIYGWRGANIKNILNFGSNFENTTIVKLEENYRSTAKILEYSNSLIEHNRDRLGKTLRSTRGEGEDVRLYESNDENDETRKIAEDVKKLLNSGVDAGEIAILYRVNALSRALEEGFNRARINYKLVGGMKFYERAEIKDLIAYFRVITNRNDNFSLKRIINKPKRGIGPTTLDKLEVEAINHKKSVFNFIEELDNNELATYVGKKNAMTLKVFMASIKDLQEILQTSRMRFIDLFDETFDFKEFYQNQPESSDRIANIDEFYGYLRDFLLQNMDANLEDFLNDISLKSDQDALTDGAVSMMSIHASKGLEYQYVFVVGMEEGFFPLVGEGSDLEEERRLGYVAFTRAKDRLTLSSVHSRFYKGRRTQLVKSRFLSESGLIEGSFSIEKTSAFKKDDIVKHKIFGMGRVLGVQKVGKDLKLNINFGGSRRDILSSFVEKI
jgi:DNA helicase II / ATP-dependent DNA helicase PcrA